MLTDATVAHHHRIGFEVTQTAGSSVRFDPPAKRARPITFHRVSGLSALYHIIYWLIRICVGLWMDSLIQSPLCRHTRLDGKQKSSPSTMKRII